MLDIQLGHEIDVFEHPNQDRYPGRRISVVLVEGYADLVPFVENEDEIFLKSIIPSRKATRDYLGDRNEQTWPRRKGDPTSVRDGEAQRVKGLSDVLDAHRAIAEGSVDGYSLTSNPSTAITSDARDGPAPVIRLDLPAISPTSAVPPNGC